MYFSQIDSKNDLYIYLSSLLNTIFLNYEFQNFYENLFYKQTLNYYCLN